MRGRHTARASGLAARCSRRGDDEQGAAVGTEQRGAPAYTIDEVYAVCRDEVLTQDPDDNFITLTFHDNGVLENCTYFPKNCADDCDTGVEISSLDMSL